MSMTPRKVYPDRYQMPVVNDRVQVTVNNEEARTEEGAETQTGDMQISHAILGVAKINSKTQETIGAIDTKANNPVNREVLQKTRALGRMERLLPSRSLPPLKHNSSRCGAPISRVCRKSAVLYD